MSVLARKPNAHETSSRGEVTVCTRRPRSKRRMHRSFSELRDIATVNQLPITCSSGSSLRRVCNWVSHSGENIGLYRNRGSRHGENGVHSHGGNGGNGET